MLKLKVKHKLLMIWLGSIILTLSVMAGLFEYQIAGLHQKDSRAAIADAIVTLHRDMELAANRVQQTTHTLAARDDLLASMNMIDHDQDPDKYLHDVFDVEKRKVADELMQHATATGTDLLALYDSKDQLAAFYVSPKVGGNGSGYVTLKNTIPTLIDSNSGRKIGPDMSATINTMLERLCQLGVQRFNQTSISHHAGKTLVLSATSPILRKRTSGKVLTIGKLLTGRLLDEDFNLSISRSTTADFHILFPGQSAQLATFMSSDEHTAPQDIPELELDGDPSPDHSTAHKWVSSKSHFLGIVRMLDQDGKNLLLVFSQQKDALQSTLQAFRSTVIAVFVITGLSIVPMGLFFLNRTITRPVDNLVNCADNLRRGHHQAMEGFGGSDEFSDLALSFQVMATAVRAREYALTQSQKSLNTAQRIARVGNWEWNLETDEVEYSDEIYKILSRDRQKLGHH